MSNMFVKFVRRGGAVAVVIPEADLAAHEGDDVPDTISFQRGKELDLPREVAMAYMDPAADYQRGVQNSIRQHTESREQITVEAPLVFTGAKAKKVVEIIHYIRWISRNKMAFQTTRKYSQYEPTDVMQLVKGNQIYTGRATKKEEDGLVIKWEAEAEDISIYGETGSAAVPLPPMTSEVIYVGQTLPYFLDIPILRDEDDGAGWYVAAQGYRDGWGGAVFYRSADSGQTWATITNGTLLTAAVGGSATTALGNWLGPNIFDETNSVTVQLRDGDDALSSATRTAVLNGSNACALKSSSGWEILQFRNAVLNGDGTYTLTGLLRGRRGTEWAMSGHAIGDTFVMLSTATLRRINDSSALMGLERWYKPVSIGRRLTQTAVSRFANAATGLECYAPVHLGGGRNAAGDLTIKWKRRTRIGGEWRDYADVPLGEGSEAYEVEIWDSAYTVLKRTITGLSSETASYTAAQQTTDFGGVQSTVYCKVFQLSATAGRGYALTGSI